MTYTTDPFITDTMIGGPIAASIYLTSNRPEVELEATLEDVSPDGTSLPLTSGALAGSFRAVDEDQTWRSADGKPITDGLPEPPRAGDRGRSARPSTMCPQHFAA